jgi:hypothetical protein
LGLSDGTNQVRGYDRDFDDFTIGQHRLNRNPNDDIRFYCRFGPLVIDSVFVWIVRHPDYEIGFGLDLDGRLHLNPGRARVVEQPGLDCLDGDQRVGFGHRERADLHRSDRR